MMHPADSERPEALENKLLLSVYHKGARHLWQREEGCAQKELQHPDGGQTESYSQAEVSGHRPLLVGWWTASNFPPRECEAPFWARTDSPVWARPLAD
jgi:hypothetical protein